MKTLARLSAVLKWLIASAGRSFSTAVAEQLRLLPLLFKVKHSFAHSFIHSIHRPPAPLSLHLSLHPRAEISELRCPSRPPFLPPLQIAPVENDDSYDELKRDAKTCLSLMSQGLLYTEQIPMVLSVLQEVSW